MNKPILNALGRKKTESIPFWFMRQAGRYLPEYRDLRAKKGGFLNMVYDPDAACEITMQPIRRFAMDGAILFSDILVVPHTKKKKLEFEAGEGPRLDPLRSFKDLEALDAKNFDSVLAPIYQTLRNVKGALEREKFHHTTLIGFSGAPWTVACYIVEGQGSKDFLITKTLSHKDPEFFTALIERLIDHTARYLCAQVDAGAEVLQIFESWAGACDAEQFDRWVIGPTRRLVEKIRTHHPHIPIIGFARMAGVHLVDYARKTGVQAVGLDSQTPPSFVRDSLQSNFTLQGNLDPALLIAGGDAMEKSALNILQTLGQGPFIFNLGHGIDKTTPVENVEHLVHIIRNFRA